MKTKSLFGLVKRRASKNIEDVRDPKKKAIYEAKVDLAEKHRRQIFKPKMSKNMTEFINTSVNRNKGASGPGLVAIRSPAKKAPTTKFKKVK